MMPEIRYARTSDGVNIAYFTAGKGPLLIDANAPPFCNAELIPRIAEYQALEGVARRATYVQYDSRGFGMSDRDVSDFSLAAMVKDIEAVADATGHPRFAMATWSQCAIPALAYAATHPDRVIALALREGFANFQGFVRSSDDLPAGLARDNWELFTRALADRTAGLLTVSGLAQMHALIKRSATQETFVRYREQCAAWDAFDLLPNVTMPVLVVDYGGRATEASRRLAAALPNGSFVSNQAPRGQRSPSDDVFDAFLATALASAGVAADKDDANGGERAALTPREIEVLRLLVAGKSGRDIAAELVLSPRTVERHVANIYRKTQTHGRAQLAAYAVRRKLG